MNGEDRVEPGILPTSETPEVRPAELMIILENVLCPHCGYNLRGLTEHRCPECGQAFDPGQLSTSCLPWVHRRRIGRLRAYWQTVWLVMFHNARFRQEFARPVSYADAQRFRAMTILHFYLPWVVATCATGILGGHTPFNTLALPVPLDVWIVVGLHAALLLAILVATGVPSYFFHPRALPMELQNRAVALSYYTSAPMAWTPALLSLVWFIGDAFDPHATALIIIIGAGLAIPFLLWWWYLVQLARHALRDVWGRVVVVAVVMPVVWIVAVWLTFWGSQMTVYFVGLMYYSLRD